MRDNVLYFPYIDVPNSAWLTRMLLYWDTVGTIMPYQFVDEPEQLSDHTRDLLQAGLLTQVFPSDYINGIPNFSGAFVSYLESLGSQLDRRRAQFHLQRNRRRSRRRSGRHQIHIEKLGTVPIHLEKTSSLADELVEMRLAERIEYPWLSVEARTAEEFMYYLATVLGRYSQLQFAPVTDELIRLRRLASVVAPEERIERPLHMLRLEVLEDVLPGPRHVLSVPEIARFKDKHGKQLRKFRRSIEKELTIIAAISDPQLRKRQMGLLKEELGEEIEDIQSKLSKSKVPDLVFGRLCAVLGEIPLIGAVPGLIHAIYEALGPSEPANTNSPLAYAAYARQELLR